MSVIKVNEKEKIGKLLQKGVPSYREAYSDRACFLMACLSELVYYKFNDPVMSEKSKELLISKVSDLIDEKKVANLKKIFDLVSYDNEAEKQKLIKEAGDLNIEVMEYFDRDDTQAVIFSSENFYALAFRGTEPDSLKDIKSDLKAKKIECESGGMIHKGFHDAFEVIYPEIQNYINENLKDKPLIITGHSLGGALATIAAKRIEYEKIAACYTFGSPRVGDEEWILGIRIPIYRIVNSADPVTMLPFGTVTNDILSFIVKFIPLIGDRASKGLGKTVAGYEHAGYMRYLTNVENCKYEETELVYSVSFLRRIKAYVLKMKELKDLPGDHSISVYREKLKEVVYKRQNI